MPSLCAGPGHHSLCALAYAIVFYVPTYVTTLCVPAQAVTLCVPAQAVTLCVPAQSTTFCVPAYAISSLVSLLSSFTHHLQFSIRAPPRLPHFSHRVRLAGMKISRPPTSVGHYKMVKHRGDKGNEENPHR